MERDVLKRTIFILLALSLLAGCSRLEPYLHVAQGGRAYANGDYQRANTAYIEASGKDDYEHWVAYDLGSVYFALGETESAENEWQIAEGTPDKNLAYRVLFNYGVLLYERGSYEEAYEKFRNALEIEPTGLEAKVNLELTMQKMEVRESKPQQAVPSSGETSAEIDLIMNYLKKMEGEVWESTEVLEYKPLPRDL